MRYGKYTLFVDTETDYQHETVLDVAEDYSREEWESLSEKKQKEYLDRKAHIYMCSYIDWGWTDS